VLVAAILLYLAALAYGFGHRPRHLALNTLPDTLRALVATVALFGIGGFGLVRLLLPARLRRHELLWVLPTGGCAVGVTMTVLGFAAVPYHLSLALVLAAGATLGAHAVRRCGWPAARWRELAWPVFLAFVVCSIALMPMVFEQGYAAPTGTGSDAHMAAGAANFLKHAYPTGVAIPQPIDRMPPLWGSKFPIYYAFAGVSSLSGLDTWQVLAPLAAALLAMAAVGIYLVVRDVFGVAPAISVAAMALAGLDRMALHTGLNPYFNQTWGYFAMPFTLVLGWWMVQPGTPRSTRRATAVLLALFGLVLVFAYPLAAPIAIVPIAIFAWSERRQRIARGERALRMRDIYRGRRSLLWIMPLLVVLSVPVAGALTKAGGAAQVLLPGHSLIAWGGDLRAFIPFHYFLSLPYSALGNLLVLAVLYLAVRGLRGQPRALAWGLGGLLTLGLLMAAYLRQRPYGYYFHFKLLAFTGPLVLAIAVVGAARLRRLGPAWIAVLLIATGFSTVAELRATGLQLPPATIQLREWARSLPKGASVRLDMYPPLQLWGAYFLAARPLCSEVALLHTDYPHVPISRKADYIVATLDRGRPADAIGAPLRINTGYRLFLENPSVPGVDACSQRMQSRLLSGPDRGPG